jgi:hypothetical protein
MAAMIPKERQSGIPPTLSLPFRCNAVDDGHWRRSKDFGGRIGSVPCAAVAALCCCTS